MFPRILYIPKSQTLLYRNINYIYMKLGHVIKNMIKFEKDMKIWENMGKYEKIMNNSENLFSAVRVKRVIRVFGSNLD